MLNRKVFDKLGEAEKEQYNVIANEYNESLKKHSGRNKNKDTAENYHAAVKKLGEFLTKHNLQRG